MTAIHCRSCNAALVCKACGAPAERTFPRQHFSTDDIRRQIFELLPATKSQLIRDVHGSATRVELQLARMMDAGQVVRMGKMLVAEPPSPLQMSGRQFSPAAVEAIAQFIAAHSGQYTRRSAAQALGMPKDRFYRYFTHLMDQNLVALQHKGPRYVMVWVGGGAE